jgi:putative oxidoreductase
MNAQFGFKIIVAGIFIVHGVARIAYGTVDDFGVFLDGKGFPLSLLLAWLVTAYEIAGGILMVAGRWVRPIALGFVAHQLLGIILVHAKNGWFVVGAGTGGMEFSVLLIASCLLIASKN